MANEPASPSGNGNGTATGAEEIVRFLADHDYKHVFGLPGSQLVSVYNRLQEADIQYVPTVHESVTIAAADGYSRITGSSVAMIYMLPGVANGLANLYNAHRDESPVIVLASQQLSTARTELGAFCEGDTVPLVQSVTSLARELTKGTPVRSWLERARRVSAGPPGGPAFLSVTEDVFVEPARVVHERMSTQGQPAAPDVAAVAEALGTAQRPLIVVGGQLRRCGGSGLLEKLAERHEIPVAFEGGLIDRLGIAPGHSHCLGSLLQAAAHEAQADVVLLLGTRSISEASPRKGPYFAQARFVAQVNRDPAKLEGTRRVDWISASDPAAFTTALSRALDAMPPAAELVTSRKEWVAHRAPSALPPGPIGKLMGGFARCLAPLHDAMERGWVVDESVMASSMLIKSLKSLDGSRYAGTSGASLGWGGGAAVGIALASGEPVTLVIGDGSLRFGVQALWTIQALNLPITIVVLNNHGYGSTRNYERNYVAAQGSDTSRRTTYLNMDMRTLGPDIGDMIRGFGIPCRSLTEQDDLRAALEQAWAESKSGPNALIMPVGYED